MGITTKGFFQFFKLKRNGCHSGTVVVHTRFATTLHSDNHRNCRIADMASSEPPKKEGQGKGVLKKEALDARVTELSTSLQEMMADGEMSGQESSANETPLTTCRN